jgi:oligopeptidase A
MTDTTDNPLLELAFAIPFGDIRASHVEPAIDTLLAKARADIDAIAAWEHTPSYDDTLGALERSGEQLEYAMAIVGHLESVVTDDELRAAYNAVQPKVAAFSSSIPLHDGLWRRIRALAGSEAAAALDPTRKRHLDKTVEEFRRHGAELDATGKAELEALDVELAKQTTKFSEHVLDSTNAWELLVTDEHMLAGLPPSAIDAARASASAKGKAGFRFTLQSPSLIPVLTYLDDPGIRRDVWQASNTRASAEPWDNRPVIAEILRLRRRKAELLGFGDFADLVLADRMAQTGARARTFVEQLRDRTEPGFARENEELAAFRREIEGAGAQPMQPWDVAYWSEKQRRARYDFDEEALRPYFVAERVIQGIFAIAHRLYGVTVEPDPTLPTWHPDASAYRIFDQDGSLLGAFYVDPYPRETKRDGAWMNGLITGRLHDGVLEPHLGLICGNLTPPLPGHPALLTHREVETIAHEFGHLLHHLLSRVSVRSLGGTNVAWDFVELPSQIMENWCWEREALDLFARHVDTGEPIPEALLEPMRRARTFRAAAGMMRQLGFCDVDLSLHTRYDPQRDGDVMAYARDLIQRYAPAPLPERYSMITGFGHLFAHPVGYAAGYYSYKWAEVLDADAFDRFASEGIFNRATGDAFRRTVLEQGDSRDPMALFREFRGRDPDVQPLLRRSGLA